MNSKRPYKAEAHRSHATCQAAEQIPAFLAPTAGGYRPAWLEQLSIWPPQPSDLALQRPRHMLALAILEPSDSLKAGRHLSMQ